MLIKIIELTLIFLKLGFITFGGPAVHIALFEQEIVTKRKWMTHEHFLDLVGATNLIPGPNSTEMTMHCGYHRAGIPGLFIAGLAFTFPAVLITGIIAYLYFNYGTLPEVKPLLYGIKPAVIIIVLSAVYKLGSKAIKEKKHLIIAIIVILMYLFGLNEIFSIFLGGVLGACIIYFSQNKNDLKSIIVHPILIFLSIGPLLHSIDKSEISLSKLFLSFLKIGTVWFGSGYVLVAYFDGEFVQKLNWLTRQELLDAIAVGQFTPGPFLSSATFIGYQIAGVSGAIISTIGIMIPSFVFVLILNPLIPRLRKSNIFSKFLDAINISTVAIMLIVGIKLGIEVLIDWKTIFIAILSTIVFLKFKNVNTAIIILGSTILGYLFHLLK